MLADILFIVGVPIILAYILLHSTFKTNNNTVHPHR